MKVQLGDSSRHNNYEEEPENVNYESITDKFAVGKAGKLFSNNNLILFIIAYVTLK